MIIDAFQAWLIHRRWSGDTSAFVTFFTREHGLMNCFYKGCRTAKKQPSLQPFTPLWLAISQRSEWNYVRHLEMASSTPSLMSDRLFSALYVNELIHYLLKPLDAHPELYDAYELIMRSLPEARDSTALERSLRRFEWCLLTACGYHYSLTHDCNTQMIQAQQNYQLQAGEGFNPSINGIKGQYILAFAKDELDDVKGLKAVKQFMRQAIDHALEGRPLKARDLYQCTR